MANAIEVRATTPGDRDWIRILVEEHWGGLPVAVHGAQYDPVELPGLVAVRARERVGLLTYNVDGDACEVVTMNSLEEGLGIGSRLIGAVGEAAKQAGCRRLWLITTNDNLHAIGFYQRRGFALVAVHREAVAKAREVKPRIPKLGSGGIPIRDEIEMELLL